MVMKTHQVKSVSDLASLVKADADARLSAQTMIGNANDE
jgi:hypothetical protein